MPSEVAMRIAYRLRQDAIPCILDNPDMEMIAAIIDSELEAERETWRRMRERWLSAEKDWENAKTGARTLKEALVRCNPNWRRYHDQDDRRQALELAEKAGI